MRSYLIILCLVLLIMPSCTAAEAPAVTGIIPAIGFNTTTVSITNLTGTNFTSGATVMLTPGTVSPVHKGSIVNGAGGATIYYPVSTFVSGNYAYVTSSGSNSLEIVDVSNPAIPVHIGKKVLGPTAYKPDDIFVSGNYAYITINGGMGTNALEIVDVSDPADPVQIGKIQDGSGALLNNPQSVYVSGTYAYVASAGSNALEIVDVSNPAAPVHKGNITDGSGGAMLNGARSVVVSGIYAYVASEGSDALEIVDVSNPAVPVHKGSIVHRDGGALLWAPVSVHVSGNYAYVASAGSNALEIVDVSNPAAPVHKGSISNSVGGALLYSPKDLYVSDTYAYVVSYSNALEIIDISTVTATGVTVGSPTKITCTFDLIGKPAGLYNVVVTNADGNFGRLASGFTVAKPDVPVANFTGSPTSGVFPLTVTFEDRSTRYPTSWNWSFGDGNFSTSQNPVYTYNRGGAYTVSLTATNAQGTGTLTRPDYIVVNGVNIGVFRNATGDWKLDYNNSGVVDKAFHFGTTGDIPVVGNWDGDDTIDAGVFRPSFGNWYLNYYKDQIVDKAFHFGIKGDIPVVGDWDGNRSTDVGIFRPSSGDWVLETTKTGVVYKRFHFGTTGDIPVVGDWDGDGSVSEAAVFRPSTGNWILNYYQNSTVNKRIHFGTAGDSPKAGMWITVNPVIPEVPVAAFTNVTSRIGIVPLTVQFTDESITNTRLTYAWDFDNNGNVESTAKNPSYTYSAAGNYTINLTVTNGAGSDSEVKTDFVTVNLPPVAPVANFTSDVQSGTAPLTVTFTDQSTGTLPLTYAWDFDNNGITDSTVQSPSHEYSTEGTYTVNLTVTNSAGSDFELKPGYIVVSPPVAPVAGFYGTPLSGPAPLLVSFTDTSTGGSITSRSWQYKNTTVDWTQFSASQNPSYTFPAGTYDIRLNVTGPGGSNTHTETGYVTASAAPVAGFSGTPLSGPAPLLVSFTDSSTGTITSRSWQYKNTTVDWTQFSTSTTPSYTFPAAVIYDIRLNVTGPGGSDTHLESGYIEAT